MEEKQQFEEWALLELFGHQRIAGKVTAVQLAGASFVRIDVPAEDDNKLPVTKYLNPSAIYSITPLSEETARTMAKHMDVAPISRWDVQELIRRQGKQLPAAEDNEEEPY